MQCSKAVPISRAGVRRHLNLGTGIGPCGGLGISIGASAGKGVGEVQS
jgi:hypothetical protein